MRIVALICNVVLFLFTFLVLATDGFPTAAIYIFFTLWTLLTMILNVVLVFRIGAREGWLGLHAKSKDLEEQKKTGGRSSISPILRSVAIVCNIVFIGFVCWAMADQPHHPKEPGFIEYLVLMVLTPILTLVVLFCSGSRGWLGFQMKGKALEE